jgi:CBS domain containing-hemolysin-like protein
MLNVKMLLTQRFMTKSSLQEWKLESHLQPVITAIETIPIRNLLLLMQKERTHMAILLDEYGGTSGLVTVEDIIEEIVGEVRDEFDGDEVPAIRTIMAGSHYIIDAKVAIHTVNELLDIDLSVEGIDTLGGWLLTVRSARVALDAAVEAEGYEFKVMESEGYHIKYVEVKKASV